MKSVVNLRDLDVLISMWLFACWTMKFGGMCQVENAETPNPKLCRKKRVEKILVSFLGVLLSTWHF